MVKERMFMTDFQTSLEKYAELAIKVGVNIQPEQTLVVNTTLEGAELVRIIVKKAYEAGTRNVIVNLERRYRKSNKI